MQKEIIRNTNSTSSISIEDSKFKSFEKSNRTNNSFRVYDGGYAGVQYFQGNVSDDEGFKQAQANLSLKRPYKFTLETGSRHRDRTEKEYSDRELMDIARECLDYLNTHYPDFRFNGNVETTKFSQYMQNTLGLDYSDTDTVIQVSIGYKHKSSKDIDDGYFALGKRTFDMKKFTDMADNYLTAFTNKAELPEELIIQEQYYGYLGKFYELLNAENLALGTSLLTGKVGQKVFADDFTLLHDVTDEEMWLNSFYDGEGVVCENDRFVYIENGVVKTGFADKFTADKYNMPHTGSAGENLADVPHNGYLSLRIKRSEKTAKELLDGRLSVVPICAWGGGYNESGEYVTPVQKSMLCDGEKLIGSLPEFTVKGSIFDIFGKDFIGVPSDNAVFEDKHVIMKMEYSK